jgi:hypothetical protein
MHDPGLLPAVEIEVQLVEGVEADRLHHRQDLPSVPSPELPDRAARALRRDGFDGFTSPDRR